MNLPDYRTFMSQAEADRQIWYNFMQQQIMNFLPQSGTSAPEGNVEANRSCLYTQNDSGTMVLWFNETGSGSKTGWIVK